MKPWIILILLLFPLCVSGQAPLGDLQADSVWLSLIDEENVLKIREDSLQTAIRTARQSLRNNADNPALSQEILRAEESLFDLRTRLGVLASRINTIEQEHLFGNLFNRPVDQSPEPANPALLIDHPYIRENLSAEEYAWLRGSGDNEIASLLYSYKIAAADLHALAAAYDAASNQSEADSLYQSFRRRTAEIRRLEADFETRWGARFDQEIYLYAYLLDRLNRTADLAALNEKAREMGGVSAGEVLSVPFAEYLSQRKLLTDYRLALARALSFPTVGIDPGASGDDGGLDFLPVEIVEREFIDYQDITFPERSLYTAENPIPALVVPESGTVYSVVVGAFSQRQPVSVFRGAAPVAYERASNGQWRYFIGLFRSYGEAAAAVERLREAGFRRPEPVRWQDGAYENLTAAAAETGVYRIRIESPNGELDPQVRTILNRYASGKEITRAAGAIYVGTFTTRLHADDTAAALRKISDRPVEIEKMEP